MRAVALLVVLIACARMAVAQPGATSPVYTASPAGVPASSGPQLSESTALWWSIGGTLASYGSLTVGAVADDSSMAGPLRIAGGIGIFIAPSFGHWYADAYLTRGLALRLGAVGTLFLGGLVALAASPCPLFGGGHDEQPCDESRSEQIMIGVAIVVGAMFIGGTVDDIVQAPRRVRRRNAPTLSLAPMRNRDATGVALAGRW